MSISENFPSIFGIFRIFFVAYMDYLAISGLFFFSKMYYKNKKKFLIFFFKPFFLFGPAILSARHSKSARSPSTPRPAPTRRPGREPATEPIWAELLRTRPGLSPESGITTPPDVQAGYGTTSPCRAPLKPQPPRPVSRASPCAAALESEPSRPVRRHRFAGVKPTGGSRRRQELRKVEPHVGSLFPARTSRRSATARGDSVAAAPGQRKKKTMRFCNLAPVFSCNI
jgi:hypothetical protein